MFANVHESGFAILTFRKKHLHTPTKKGSKNTSLLTHTAIGSAKYGQS